MIKTVFAVSDSIKDSRGPYEVLTSLVSEVGELADEVGIQEGHFLKEVGPDGILGEAVDVIICALDMVRVVHPEVTEKDLIALTDVKCQKWFNIKG